MIKGMLLIVVDVMLDIYKISIVVNLMLLFVMLIIFFVSEEISLILINLLMRMNSLVKKKMVIYLMWVNIFLILCFFMLINIRSVVFVIVIMVVFI